MHVSASTTESAPPALLIDVAEAARLLGVSRRSVYLLIQDRGLPSVTIGKRRLFRPSDLSALVDRQFAATAAEGGPH